MRFSSLAAAILFFSFTASAADFQPPGTSLTGTPSGIYEADPAHASILFNYVHMGFSHPVSRFKHFNSTLKFDAAHPENSKLDVTINMNSIESGSDAMDAKFLSKELFDTQQYPTAHFTSTRILRTSDHTGRIYGDLTLHGITKPIVLEVTLNGAGTNPMIKVPMLGFSAHTTVSRTAFLLGFGVPMVSDKVNILIEAEYHLKQAANPAQ